LGPAAAWATLGGVKGDAAVPEADDAAVAATNKLGSMISVTERRIVEFSHTLPELRTSSSLRQSLDNMLAFLETSALDLWQCEKRMCRKHCEIKREMYPSCDVSGRMPAAVSCVEM
jgi:hypothetical protein